MILIWQGGFEVRMWTDLAGDRECVYTWGGLMTRTEAIWQRQ